MATILIVNIADLSIATAYQAAAPNQSLYGGPWGDPNETMHVVMPAGLILSCVSVDSSGNVTQDPTKYAAYQAAQTSAAIVAAVQSAMAFGNSMIVNFSAQNIALGITAANMTATVLTVMQPVISCLQTGSLQDAITQAKAIPTGSYDATFVTATRLLAAVNQIETYLGITLSTAL